MDAAVRTDTTNLDSLLYAMSPIKNNRGFKSYSHISGIFPDADNLINFASDFLWSNALISRKIILFSRLSEIIQDRESYDYRSRNRVRHVTKDMLTYWLDNDFKPDDSNFNGDSVAQLYSIHLNLVSRLSPKLKQVLENKIVEMEVVHPFLAIAAVRYYGSVADQMPEAVFKKCAAVFKRKGFTETIVTIRPRMGLALAGIACNPLNNVDGWETTPLEVYNHLRGATGALMHDASETYFGMATPIEEAFDRDLQSASEIRGKVIHCLKEIFGESALSFPEQFPKGLVRPDIIVVSDRGRGIHVHIDSMEDFVGVSLEKRAERVYDGYSQLISANWQKANSQGVMIRAHHGEFGASPDVLKAIFSVVGVLPPDIYALDTRSERLVKVLEFTFSPDRRYG